MKKEEFKTHKWIENLTGIAILAIILVVGIAGVHHYLILKYELKQQKLAHDFLFHTAEKIQEMTFETVNRKNIFEKIQLFSKDTRKYKDLKDGEIIADVILPEGKNSELKKIVLSLSWTLALKKNTIESLTLFLTRKTEY